MGHLSLLLICSGESQRLSGQKYISSRILADNKQIKTPYWALVALDFFLSTYFSILLFSLELLQLEHISIAAETMCCKKHVNISIRINVFQHGHMPINLWNFFWLLLLVNQDACPFSSIPCN